MQSALTLLEHIVDYAGLFPPAKLDMAPTVRNYAAFRSGSDDWMLGRIIVPVARLEEFEQEAESLLPRVPEASSIGTEDDDVWSISALTVAADDPALEADLAAIDAFNDRHAQVGAGAAHIDTIELRAASPLAIERAIDLVPEHVFPFFEIPLAGDQAGDCRGLITAIAGVGGGAKARTGGVTADAIPSVEALARFLAACVAAEVPFKATAGLHHPLRHHATSVGADMHGFLNVFAGACVAWAHGLDEAALRRVLEHRDIDAFRFDDDGLAVDGLAVDVGRIGTFRDAIAHAFGSCSFDEPLADLRTLKLIGLEGSIR